MNSILATERLTLRPFTAADRDAYAAMCADAEVMRHIGDGGLVGREIDFLGQPALVHVHADPSPR